MKSLATSGLPLFDLPSTSSQSELDGRLRALTKILSDRQWHTSKQLAVHEFTDRELRDLVEHSDGRILSFPGSPGYKLFEAGTIEEQTAAFNSLRNQARRMIGRAIRYRRRLHSGK